MATTPFLAGRATAALLFLFLAALLHLPRAAAAAFHAPQHASKPLSFRRLPTTNRQKPRWSLSGQGELSAATTDVAVEKSKAAQEAEGVVIVGAGIAGLATAAALRSIAGVTDVRVVERFDESSFRDDRAGAGAQLGPNGLRALRAIGGEDLLGKALSSGTKLAGNAVALPSPPGTAKIPDSAEADTGLPQVLLRWGALRSMLADLIPDGRVSCGVGGGIAGYRVADDGGVELVGIEAGDDVAALSPAPLIVAADGIYSTFRPLVRSGATELSSEAERKEGVKYNGRVNIKAVVESELGEEFEPGHTYSFFTPGGGVACFAGPAGDGYTYWAISIVDPSEQGDSKESDDEVVRLASEPETVDRAKLKEALLKKLLGLEEPLCRFAVDKIRETDPRYIFVSPSEEAEEIGPDLVSADGRVVLVGDAAHAFSPSYGQGANFALEDAASLAACVRDSDALATALERYGRSRVERCAEMQRRSAERAAKAMRGEHAEDVSKWIFQWEVPNSADEA